MFTGKDGHRRNKVVRKVGDKEKAYNVKAYILMRSSGKDFSPIVPDYKEETKFINKEGKEEKTGLRYVLNAYTINVSAGEVDLEQFTERVWDKMCHMLIGEKLDPAECIHGVWLEDASKGGRGNVALKLEVWFSIRDDVACAAICDELRKELLEAVTQTNVFGDRHVLMRIPEFKKLLYFSEHNPKPNAGKHKVGSLLLRAHPYVCTDTSVCRKFNLPFSLTLAPTTLPTTHTSLRSQGTSKVESWVDFQTAISQSIPRTF